jgi:hypothetical protein
MTVKSLIAIFVFMLSALFSHADSPPCWCAFETESSNKQYVAVVTRPLKDSLVEPWNSEWTLSIFQKEGDSRMLLWETKYAYTGYPDGALSDDGNTFIYVEYWFYPDAPLLQIYNRGKRINTKALKGTDFKISKSKLVETVSHFVWLYEDGNAYSFKKNIQGGFYFQIRTVDGKMHYVNIYKGEFIKPEQIGR